MNPDELAILQSLRAEGLVRSEDARMTPFGGGVSSDVWRVDDGGKSFVVKRSVAKLRVAADWYADPARLIYEFRYLQTVSRLVPGVVPAVLNPDISGGYIAMEFLGEGFTNWKQDMLDGSADPVVAERAATALAKIHNSTRNDATVRSEFDSLRFFTQLRIDAYLRATALKHPKLANQIEEEAQRLSRSSECLVHGDFSPKNMLVSKDRFVVLDCETAWFGEPAFDLAFLLNHLHLKALHHSPKDIGMAALVQGATDAYFATSDGEAPRDLNLRTARLLLVLMLARVDGKSPVEYLSNQPEKQAYIREFVTHRLGKNLLLQAISQEWFGSVNPS
ncbi:MAG: aminoglycoside phosphotransferase family protein [Terrimicrobiaceae bacterium]